MTKLMQLISGTAMVLALSGVASAAPGLHAAAAPHSGLFAKHVAHKKASTHRGAKAKHAKSGKRGSRKGAKHAKKGTKGDKADDGDVEAGLRAVKA